MNIYKILLFFLAHLIGVANASPIGFEGLSPPYPVVPAHPQPPNHFYPSVTSCTIPAGVYRIDMTNRVRVDKISVSKLTLYLHVSNAGLIAFRVKLKPKSGRVEEYLVMPYSSSSDLVNVCDRMSFTFFFNNINVYGKTLSGTLAGYYVGNNRGGEHYIATKGRIERVDSSYGSRVAVELSASNFSFVYPYLR